MMKKSGALAVAECMRTEKNTLMPYGARMNTLGLIGQTFLTQLLTFTREAKSIAEVLSLRKAVSDMEPYGTTLYAKIEFKKLEELKKKYTEGD